MCLKGILGSSLPHYFTSQPPWDEWLYFTMHYQHAMLPHNRTKTNEPTDYGLKPEIVNQNKLFLFLNWLSKVFCHSNGKQTNTVLPYWEPSFQCMDFWGTHSNSIQTIAIYTNEKLQTEGVWRTKFPRREAIWGAVRASMPGSAPNPPALILEEVGKDRSHCK